MKHYLVTGIICYRNYYTQYDIQCREKQILDLGFLKYIKNWIEQEEIMGLGKVFCAMKKNEFQ